MGVFYEVTSENTIKAILVDNTNDNTGYEGGMVTILEKEILTQLVSHCTIIISEQFEKKNR